MSSVNHVKSQLRKYQLCYDSDSQAQLCQFQLCKYQLCARRFFKSLVLSNPHLNFEDYERVIPVGLFIFIGNAVHIKEVCN